MGTRKKTASQTTGSPSRPGAVRSGRGSRRRGVCAVSSSALASTATGSLGRFLGGLHLLPELLVLRPPRDVAVEVRIRRPEGLRVADLERLCESARRRAG